MTKGASLFEASPAGGCACKVPPTALNKLLSHLATQPRHGATSLGLSEADDAAVLKASPDMQIVFTVDFFTPVVDDAEVWGEIAVANSLSDVYAMGGEPTAALNILSWPDILDGVLLKGVLAGAQRKAQEAGVEIVGGHTVRGETPLYGLAVIGQVDSTRVVTKAAGRPGDDLVLTKPVGTGVISTAARRGLVGASQLDVAIASMTSLNRDAARAATASGILAGTDVTGYGLAGHAAEIARASNMTATLFVESIPVLDGALDLARRGVETSLTEANLQASLTHTALAQVLTDPGLRMLLGDPQTSGGLLLSVDRTITGAFLGALRATGIEGRIVGQLQQPGDFHERPVQLSGRLEG